MKQRIVSSTYLKTYVQCLLKFYFRYYTDKEPIMSGDSRAFGTALHSALEAMYKTVGMDRRKPVKQDYDYVLDVFLESGIKNRLSDQALYDEGRAILTNRLDRYNTAEVVLGLELRFGHPYDNPKMPVITSGGTPLTGAIDKVLELDKDTVVVVDYKSSQVALTEDEALKDEQLSLYDLAVSRLFPQYKNVIVVLDYLRKSPVVSHRTEEQRVNFSRYVDKVYQLVGEQREEDVKPTLNEYCGWCDYRTYCPAYCKAITDVDQVLPSLATLTDKELVGEWIRFEHVRKAVNSYHNTINMHLASLARDREVQEVVGEHGSLYRIQNTMVSYDPATVVSAVPKEHLASLVSINKKSMDRFLQEHPEYYDAVMKNVSVSFSSSFFKLKKSSGGESKPQEVKPLKNVQEE